MLNINISNISGMRSIFSTLQPQQQSSSSSTAAAAAAAAAVVASTSTPGTMTTATYTTATVSPLDNPPDQVRLIPWLRVAEPNPKAKPQSHHPNNSRNELQQKAQISSFQPQVPPTTATNNDPPKLKSQSTFQLHQATRPSGAIASAQRLVESKRVQLENKQQTTMTNIPQSTNVLLTSIPPPPRDIGIATTLVNPSPLKVPQKIKLLATTTGATPIVNYTSNTTTNTTSRHTTPIHTARSPSQRPASLTARTDKTPTSIRQHKMLLDPMGHTSRSIVSPTTTMKMHNHNSSHSINDSKPKLRNTTHHMKSQSVVSPSFKDSIHAFASSSTPTTNTTTTTTMYFKPNSKEQQQQQQHTHQQQLFLATLQASTCIDSYRLINENFSKKISLIDTIESKFFQKSSMLNGLEQFKYPNGVTSLSSSFSNRIRKPINLITSNSIDSQRIQKGMVNVLRCEINEFLYFKIRVSEEMSPMRLRFVNGNSPAILLNNNNNTYNNNNNNQSASSFSQHSTQNQWSNVRLFGSRTSMQPNNFNSDFACKNAKFLVLNEERNSSHFSPNHPYFYFSLVSDQLMNLTVFVAFGQDKKNPNAKSANGAPITTTTTTTSKGTVTGQGSQALQGKDPTRKRRGSDSSTSSQSSQTSKERNQNSKEATPKKKEIFALSMRELKHPKQTDPSSIVFKNIVASSTINKFTKNLEIYAKKHVKEQHLDTVCHRADQIETERLKAIEKIHLEKTAKQLAKLIAFRKQFFVYFWSQIIKLVQLSDEMNRRYVDKKESIQYFSKLAWMALPLRNKLQSFQQKYPRDEIKSYLRYGYIGMRNLANLIQKKKKAQAGVALVAALKYNQVFSILRDKFFHYTKIVIRVQQTYRIFRTKKTNFKKLLIRLWDKYFYMVIEPTIEVKVGGGNDMTSSSGSSSGNETEQQIRKKKQNLIASINSPAIKTFAVEQYFTTQIRSFTTQFEAYLRKLGSTPKDQRRKILVVQALFAGQDEIIQKMNAKIFDKFEEDAVDNVEVTFDRNRFNPQSSTANGPNQLDLIHKPRLFVVPTLTSILQLFREGVSHYINQNPIVLEKFIFKQTK